MNKQEVLQNIKTLIDNGQLSKADILGLFNTEVDSKKKSSLGIINILYGIGGLVIFAGVIALIVQNWDSLGSFARVLITLGMAIVLYISSIMVLTRQYNVLAQILISVSYILFPLGIGVMLNELSINPEIGAMSIIGILLTVLAVITYLLFKDLIFSLLFSVFFGTISAYLVLAYILEKASMTYEFDIYLYLTIALGITHALLAYAFTKPQTRVVLRRLGGLFYGTGTLGVLIGALSLGGVWDVLFIFVVIGTFLLSVYVHSRGMLFFSSIFFLGYLFKITGEYFAGSIGWPIALILIGIITIVVAIGTFKINQKYFRNAAQLRSQEN